MELFENQPAHSPEQFTKSSIDQIYLEKRLKDKKIINLVDCAPETESYIRHMLLRYPSIGVRFLNVASDPYLKNEDGIFIGGLGKGEGGSFEIRIRQGLFKAGSGEKCRKTFDHEMGHAMFIHIRDVQNFLSYNKIELPESVSKMIDFIDLFANPKLYNLFKSPRRFVREYVSFYGETEKIGGKAHPLEEKFAELFLLANSGSRRTIALQFNEIFTEEAFREDWSYNIHDQKILDSWNKFFRPDRRG